MKKMLLLVGMLAVSGLSFAKEADELPPSPNPGFGAEFGAANATQEESIEVKARVITPLTIEKESDVNFGILVKGKEGKKYPEVDGTFIVRGELNQIIDIYVKGDTEKYEKVNTMEPIYDVTLVKEKGEKSNPNQTLLAKMSVISELGDAETHSFTLDYKTGERKFKVGGEIAGATLEQESGEYKGILYVKAQYE